MVTEIHSSEDFAQNITNHKGYALIDFWATWCGPCRMMAPVVEKAEAYLGSKINFTKIDVDEQQDLAAKYDIMSIPTFILFKDGEEVDRMIGAVPQDEFVGALEEAVKG